MERENIRKIKKYIKDDRPSKLKSYVKKNRVSVKDVELSKGRSLLHYCCLNGSGVVLRFLLHEGVNPVEPDNNGNLPLHVCLQRALDVHLDEAKEVYSELVLPLLERAPQALEEKNHDQISCRDLLEEVVARNTNETSQERETSDAEWREKLAEELTNEQDDTWGRYQTETDYWEEQTYESYDQWADRLHSDYKLKHRHRFPGQHHSTRKHCHHGNQKEKKDTSHIIDEEELKRTREKLKRKYEENQKRDVKNHKARRRAVYENGYNSLLKTKDSELNFADIPWPSKGSMSDTIDVIFCDMPDKSSPQFKKYLREQQIRWHPDKFTQKFGKRLSEDDKLKIMERVKEISQALNKLSETLPS